VVGITQGARGPVCAACGQPVDPDAFVCLNCGDRLQSAAPTGHIPPPPGMPLPPPPAPAAAPPPPPLPARPAPVIPPPPRFSATDSFTLQVPSADLPPAPPSYPDRVPFVATYPPPPPAGEPDESDDPTVVLDRRPKAEWLLRLPDGAAVPVDGLLVLGRRPQASSGPAGARLVAIADPGRTVSRTHVAVEPNPGIGILVRDLLSANGIVLVAPDGAESEIEPGGSVLITDVCSIVLGTVAIGIERAA